MINELHGLLEDKKAELEEEESEYEEEEVADEGEEDDELYDETLGNKEEIEVDDGVGSEMDNINIYLNKHDSKKQFF